MSLELDAHLEHLQEFQGSNAYDRIERWYVGDAETREQMRLERPPHENLCDSAADLVRFSFEVGPDDSETNRAFEYPPYREVRGILQAIGVERLLTAIALKEDPESFIEYCQERDRTPSFGTLLNDHVPGWTDHLSAPRRDRVDTVLRILKARRNNLVHFGFHRIENLPAFPAYYDVIAYLFDEFFEDDRAVVSALRDSAGAARQPPSYTDNEWLCFDFEGEDR